MLKFVSIALVVALAAFLYSTAWSFAFSLLNTQNDFAVIIGISLIGTLAGLTIYGIVRLVKFADHHHFFQE